MGEFTIFLSEITEGDLVQVGGKGANLGRLTRLGVKMVPSAFAVKTVAFDRFLEVHGLNEKIQALIVQIDFNNMAAVEEKTAAIRELVETQEMPQEIAGEIQASYRQMIKEFPQALVAVRSSVGTRDQKRSSFPGMMDTYHNVKGEEEVLRLVRKCWASIWTARAASFRSAANLDHQNVFIAPLVQVMVPSETSGVLFTANPLTGNRNEIMINASYGLGEAVVSGVISPDLYIIDKQTRKVISSEVGNKCFQWILDTERGQGNRKVAVPSEMATCPCLTPEQLEELLHLALLVEGHYGEPQDIEWAYAQGRLYVLQTRRITALDKAEKAAALPEEWFSEFDSRVGDPPDTYTSANIGEALPDVLSPVTISWLKVLDYGVWKSCYDMGLVNMPFPEDPREYVFLGCFYGRAFLNVSTFTRFRDKIPGAADMEFDRPRPREMGQEDSPSIKFSIKLVPFLVKVCFRAMRRRIKLPGELRCQFDIAKQRIEKNRQLDFTKMELADLAAIVKINHDESKHLVAIHNDNTFFAVAYYATLSKKMRRLLGDETGAFTSRLVTGLATLESAKPVFEIYRLFELVAISPELTKIFQMTEVNDILNRLQESQHQEVKDFLTQMTQFLLKYGYRAVSEAELMHPSWEEDPSFVFSMIQNYLNASKAGKVENPQVIETRQRLERQSAVREMHARLGFFNRRIFDYLLKETCTFIPGRENNKAVVMMGSNEVKRAMNEIGRRLVKSGQIEDKKDLYFLTIDEILALCRGEGVDVNGLIPNRKAEYYRNQTVRLPETFRGHPRPLPPEEEASNEAAQGTQVLKGLPISPGRVTGPARVILDPMQESRIAPGEILVAPVTDASWTPLFLLAKGLVVDIGGLLSHGSVVAREYGIPGVLNVINGTKRIKNGQIITVDGNRGEVYLHPQSGQ